VLDSEILLRQVMDLALKIGDNAANPEVVNEIQLQIKALQIKIDRIEKDLYPEGSSMSFLVIREYVEQLKKQSSQNRNYFIGAVISLVGSLILFLIQFLTKQATGQ